MVPAINAVPLEGRIEDIGSLHFLRAEQQAEASRFVLIRYALDGQEQPLGIRLDLDKKALLDSVGDPELDKHIQAVVPTLWSIIANDPFADFSGADLGSDSRLSRLGALADLAGTWVGAGFNLISLPDRQHNADFRLQVRPTRESLEFTVIGGGLPVRGWKQNDILLNGLTYRHLIRDTQTRGGLHFEPGLWFNVPSTIVPNQPATVVRQAARIQHGGVLLAQGHAFSVAGPPAIHSIDSTPFTGAIPDLGAAPANPITFPAYTNTPLPAEGLPLGLNAAQTIKDPTVILRAAIAGQVITKATVITVSTAQAGGIINIPFAVQNANAVGLDAIFWIERVSGSNGNGFLQLQYVQRIIVAFNALFWPHISVATLVKQ
jgi:hypothetical protein